MEEIKPLNTEKPEFENRDDSIIKALSGNLDHQDSDATVKVNHFSIKSSFNVVQFSLDTLMEETKLVGTEIHVFEYWDNSLLLAFLGNFGQSSFACKRRSKRLLNRISL